MSGLPHQGQAVKTLGSLDEAEKAVILLHGRGATADSILAMVEDLPDEHIAYLAPQAKDCEWYPASFLMPLEANEPGRTSALDVISTLIEQAEDAGVPQHNVFIAGFSQGACLTLEYAARNPENYGGILGFSGGLIGESIDPSAYSGNMEGTPVFLGCSDEDPYIPLERVNETAAVFESLHASVEKRIYKGMGHTINTDEFTFFQTLLSQ